MAEKKLGLWLPAREKLERKPGEESAILLKEVRDKLVSTLKAEKDIKLVQDLDFRNAVIKNGEVFLNKFCFSELDLFFWFSRLDKSLNSFHIEVLKAIQKKSKVVNNPDALFIGIDKFKSQEMLRDNNIRVPDTLLLSDSGIDFLPDIIKGWEEVLIKPRLGSFGVGMVRVKDKGKLMDIIDYANQGTHYLERFIPNDMNEWCGINVVNQKVIHGYGKKPEAISSWKVYDRKRQGGKMVFKNPNSEQKKIALKVGKITGLDVFAVDIIKGNDGKYYVIDVNTFPGLYPEMYEQAELNLFDELIACIRSKLK